MEECGAFGSFVHDNAVTEVLKQVARGTMIVPVELVDAGIADLNLGIPLDSVKFITHILMAMPLGVIHAYLPVGKSRHLYNLFIGVVVAQFLFAEAWINVGLAALLTRLIISLLPQKATGIVTFIIIMIFMVGTMAERLSCAWMSYKMDYTGAQMMATIKLTTFAWNYSDGKKGRNKAEREKVLAEKRDELKRLKSQKEFSKTAARKVKGAIGRLEGCWDEVPDILTYMGWAYQFSGYPVGPAIELREYIRGCESNPSKQSASRILPATSKFFAGLGFLVLFKSLGALFPVGAAADWTCTFDGCVPTGVTSDPAGILDLPGGSVLSPAFGDKSFPSRFLYMLVAAVIVRARYYFAWLTAEAAFNVAGFGYSPDSKTSSFFGLFKEWDGMANVDIYSLETSTDMKLMRFWNLKTQRWLVSCVFKRVPSSSTVRMIATYFISALWHGIYPGYYVCFLGAAFITTCTGDFNSKLPGRGLLFEGNKTAMEFLSKILKWLLTFASMSFVVLGLLFLSLEHTYVAQKNMSFYLYPLLVGVAVIFKFIPKPKKKAKKA
eukprot:g30.t1